MILINNVVELREAIEDGWTEFMLLLKNGAYADKHIKLFDGEFEVWHMPDGYVERLSEKQLLDSSIGRAMKQNALYQKDS